ncbi:MAG: ABC transporter permease [Opitutaceae bacterium]|jgi:oligopeptide transport system permease protein|nr:ABC transporter permease [Opitutaceae bacterium]
MSAASASPVLPAVAAPASRSHSPWHDAWLRLRRNRLAVVSGVFVLALALACIAMPPFLEHGYADQNLARGATAPSAENWLGTDELGRDLLARLLYGGRISLMVGFVASLVALFIGVTYGAISGYAGGRVDAFLMRVVDILYALPFTIFVILMMVFLKEPMDALDAWLREFALLREFQGIGKIVGLFAAIGAVEWLTMARIVRGQVLSVKKMEYIEAARTLGYGHPRIIFRHIVPNILGPVIVFTTLTIPAVMMLESFLSFLGLGVDAPLSSWGTLIKDGADKMENYPWLLVFPGTVFALTLLALNLLGDGLRDALDVRAAKD